MKVVQINTVCGSGSTGKICQSISELLTKYNCENYVLHGGGKTIYPLAIQYSGDKYTKYQALKSKVFGNYGFNSNFATKKIICELEKIKPDIIHLHNIHSHDCNLDMLFTYLKKEKKKIIWTFHDCWAFTAYCVYFTRVNCNKWRNNCKECVQYKEYSWFYDKSSQIYERKKELFSNLDLSIVTPSIWLAEIVKESFLKEYPLYVINNGIDLDIFAPRTENIYKKYSIPLNKKILLGVANEWDVRKGLDVFVELSKQLPKKKFQIILVGTNENVEHQLPDNIISIRRTDNQSELAEIYSAADVFINPTREENFPTVNIEALACGTPVITFETGGSPEILDETCGRVVDCDNIYALVKAIENICEETPFSVEMCRKRSECFDKEKKFEEYIALYRELTNE